MLTEYPVLMSEFRQKERKESFSDINEEESG